MNASRWPRWMKAHVARHKRSAVLALALGLAASACAALLMFTSGYLISATALASTTLFSIMVPIGCVQLFGFGRPLARYVERLASHDWVLKVTSDLRLSLFRGIEERTDDPARERATGEYLGLLADDVAHLQNLYLRVVFPSVVAYLLALLASVLFGFFSLALALLMLMSMIVVAVVVPLVTLISTRSAMGRAKQLKSSETIAVTDDVSGSVDWVLSGRSSDAVSAHRSLDAHARSLEARIRARQRLASLVVTVLFGALVCVVVVWAGNTLERPGNEANWIAALALGTLALVETFAILPVAISESTTHRDAIRRLDEYVGTKDERCAETPAGGAHPLEFSDVTYAYPNADRPALEHVSITFERLTSTAILGRSGSGKSTFVKLACATLSPLAGSVSVQGSIGYLDQNPYLFNRTLRENLKMGAPDADDKQLVALLESVGLADKLASMPHGLDSVIGETGIGFSGGEAHRVALARVLAAQASIIIVDEPFSALDEQTETGLLDTLLATCADKTLIVVTHHLAHIERFDRIVFIEDARIDLDGAPSQLLATSERFRTLVDLDRR